MPLNPPTIVEAVRWAPDGKITPAAADVVARLLADADGRINKYGEGKNGTVFEYESGERIAIVLPGQWVSRWTDGRVTVTTRDLRGLPWFWCDSCSFGTASVGMAERHEKKYANSNHETWEVEA